MDSKSLGKPEHRKHYENSLIKFHSSQSILLLQTLQHQWILFSSFWRCNSKRAWHGKSLLIPVPHAGFRTGENWSCISAVLRSNNVPCLRCSLCQLRHGCTVAWSRCWGHPIKYQTVSSSSAPWGWTIPCHSWLEGFSTVLHSYQRHALNHCLPLIQKHN